MSTSGRICNSVLRAMIAAIPKRICEPALQRGLSFFLYLWAALRPRKKVYEQ